MGLFLLLRYQVLLLVSYSFGTTWTAACQAPMGMGFPRQENWHGLPFPSPGHLPNTGIGSGSPALWVDSLPTEPPGNERNANQNYNEVSPHGHHSK